ncbi:sulfatase family protein [Algibacter pacificus]|uniref:sulfatase family protein n=1 Tax=Algibacter pacificus TaxID=2599389 RepID=UPI0011CA2344|nr:sulfatase [Algibacter pacificus]
MKTAQKNLYLLVIAAICFSCKNFKKYFVKEKPLNIVFILTDDQGAHLSALGTKGILTPNVDGLVKKGMLFTNSFAVVSSCSPSRSSIMTGMYPHANGHWRNTITPHLNEQDSAFGRQSKTVDKVGIHEYIKTLPELLQKHGYFTGITQKFHMSPPWKFPYSERNPVSNNPDEFKKVISQYITNAGNKPFFIQANIAPPHRNFNHHMDEFSEFLPNPKTIEVPKYLADTPLMREDLAKYYGSVQLADACVGSIISVLKERNLLEHTIIIFTADQGEPYHRAKASPYYAGLHVPFVASGPGIVKNKISNALISHIDIMPTLLDYAKISIPESVQGYSLKPIFTGKQKKIAIRKYIFGEHNSHGPIRAEHYPSRVVFDGRFYYIKNLIHEKSYKLPADLMVKKGWGNQSYQATLDAKKSHPVQYHLLKQLESGRPKEELYDVNTDSGQIHNLMDNPKFKGKLQELRTALNNWRIETDDLVDDPLSIKSRQLNK